MALTSHMVPLGTTAPEFSLPDLDGNTVARDDFAGRPLLVMFACNHCPYVKHLENDIPATLDQFPSLATVAICSNDAENYPDDGPEGLRDQAARAKWRFPYLVDDTQEVARAYNAACTPDFFLFDAEHKLAYRGSFDASTPGNGKPIDGEHLADAITYVLAGRDVPEPHHPSTGCGIKWRE